MFSACECMMIVHTLFIDVMHDLILILALPRHNHDAADLLAVAQIHHPHGLLNVEVVEDRTAVQRLVEVAVDGTSCVSAHPRLVVTRVTLLV